MARAHTFLFQARAQFAQGHRGPAPESDEPSASGKTTNARDDGLFIAHVLPHTCQFAHAYKRAIIPVVRVCAELS